MSREAWGDPPDREPDYCPVCGETHHTQGCPVYELDKRRIAAEDEVMRLRAECEALRADAERGAYVVRNGGWIRSERDGCAYLTVRLPLAADLSCVATRRAAIDAARAAKEQSNG